VERSPNLIANRPAIGPAVVHGLALAIACLISYWLSTHVVTAVHSLSETDDMLGGMWSVIATIFVFRLTYSSSISAAASRTVATVVSFVLCIAYLLVFPFHALGLAAVVGLGAVILLLARRGSDVVTAGVTTAVILVVAAQTPDKTWEPPVLRLINTAIGIGVGLAMAWLTRRLGPRLTVRVGSGRYGSPQNGPERPTSAK
jgi:uncharacterized membrane protein YccC